MTDLSELPVLILAGGLGTRLKQLWDGPKCLVPVCGMPLIHWQLAWLEEQGFINIHLLLGYKADEVIRYINSRRMRNRMIISHRKEAEQQGTRAAVASTHVLLRDRYALVMNGDTLYGSGYRMSELVGRFFRRGNDVLRVVGYDSMKLADGLRDSGLRVLSPTAIRGLRAVGYKDLETALTMLDQSHVMVQQVEDVFYDVGTPIGLQVAEEFLRKKGYA